MSDRGWRGVAAVAALGGAAAATLALAPAPARGGADADLPAEHGHFDVVPEGAFLGGHRAPVRTLSFSADGKLLASGSDDGNVVIWDPLSKDLQRSLAIGGLSVRGVAFGKMGKEPVVAVAHGTTLSLWKAASGEKLWESTPTDGGVLSAVAWSAKGDTIYAGDLTGAIAMVRAKDGKKTSGWKAYEAEVRSLSTSPKSGLVAASGDMAGAHYWAPPKGKRVKDVSFADGGLVAFSPDGTRVALAGDLDKETKSGERITGPGVLVLDVPDGDEMTRVMMGASSGAHLAAVAWHKSGKLIAVAMTAGPSMALELNPAKFFYSELGTNRASAAFSPDGTMLVVGASNSSGLVSAFRVTEK